MARAAFEPLDKDFAKDRALEMARMRDDGHTVKSIAGLFGLSRVHVHRVLKEFGYSVRLREPCNVFQVEDKDNLLQRIVVDREMGMTWQEISDKYRSKLCVTSTLRAVKRYCLRRGIEWPIRPYSQRPTAEHEPKTSTSSGNN